jgi:hypothetical protein
MVKRLSFLLPFLLVLVACTPPSGLTTVLLSVQVAIEAAGPIIAAHAGPQATQAIAYVNAALSAVQTSATVLGRGPVTQSGADEIVAAWANAVLDPAVLQGASPDVVAILTGISNAAKAFVHQFTQGRAAVSAAARAPMPQVTFTFSRSDRRALADIQKRAIAARK